MFVRTAAFAIAALLTCTAADAETPQPPAYQMPSIIETLVTAGATFDGSFTDDQFAAYCLTFGMTLSQTWPDVLPEDFNDRAFGLLRGLIIGGSDVNGAAIAGGKDAETFVASNDQGSDETRNVVVVLNALLVQ
jgi:hypothetical protein